MEVICTLPVGFGAAGMVGVDLQAALGCEGVQLRLGFWWVVPTRV
jgi:hypothetical protein